MKFFLGFLVFAIVVRIVAFLGKSWIFCKIAKKVLGKKEK
jgi:hypothetical protein